jgi:two-component system LytT family response regulator
MITAILVDDEPKSIMNLEYLLREYCKEVSIINKASNALEAVKHITNDKPDVVFLDVQMPGYSGFDVLHQIKGLCTKIIFTTAHKQYAISAIRHGAFDYLLKPIDTEELIACVSRVNEQITEKSQASELTNIIELSVRSGIIFVRPEEIIHLEASGSYTTFYLENSVRHVVSKSLKEYEPLLSSNVFFRCHNSHIINLKKVLKFSNSNGYFAELSDGSSIEIARKNKDLFLEKLKHLKV